MVPIVFSWFVTAAVLVQDDGSVSGLGSAAYLGTIPGFYTDIGVSALVFGMFEVGGDVRTYETKDAEGVFFDPFRANYSVWGAFNLGPARLEIRHECDHPVFSNADPPYVWIRNVTSISVTIRGSTSLGKDAAR